MSCEKEPRPTHSRNIPTEMEVIRHTLRSPRMAALFFSHFEAPPSSTMIQTLSIDEKTNIRYIFPPLENELELTEIDFLFQKGFLNTRTKNALRRAGIIQICQLPQVIDGSLGVRGISKKYREDLSNCLKQFVQMVIQKQEESPGKIVILETPTLPISKKQIVPEKWIKKWTPVIKFVRTWQDEHPGKWGALTTAAEHFEITRERVRQIVTKYEKITGESLKPEKATSLFKLAHELGTKSPILLKLLHQGKISFGEKIDPLYTAPESPSWVMYRLKVIPISSINKDELKRQLAGYLLVAKVMERLTYATAQRNKDTFFPLSKLARQANMGNLQQLSEIFNELTAAGFHLRKLPTRPGGNAFYYYAHREETKAIVSYLKEKYRAEPKISPLFGPSDAPIPTTTEFENQFVSVLKTLREAGLRVHPGLLRGVLNIIFQENLSVPIYRRHRHTRTRIPPEHLELFKTKIFAKKEEIIAFLEAHRHKS